jgi:hypothetical protein
MNIIKDNFRAAVACITIMCFTFLIYSDKITFAQAIASVTAVASGFFYTKKQEAEIKEEKERRRADEAEKQLKEYKRDKI